jgi:thymidylate synthase (FAD)
MTNQTDILDHSNYIPLLNQGFVGIADEEMADGTLVPSVMGNDKSISRSARMSYGKGTRSINDDTSLIRYLLRHKHTTPFEMAEIKFHAKMPIFVARQWVRHRTASINEYSARYSILTDEFYLPEAANLMAQSVNNKQGRDGQLSISRIIDVQNSISDSFRTNYALYESLLDEEGSEGIARELARMVLPTNGYTEWYWKANLHNILNFLRLRMDTHAQYEIRVYADAMFELVKKYFPIACAAYEDYILNAESFSAMEMKIIHQFFNKTMWDSYFPSSDFEEEFRLNLNMSKREWDEFKNKMDI